MLGTGPPRVLLLLLDPPAYWHFQHRNKENIMKLKRCRIKMLNIRMIRMLIKTWVNMNDREAIKKDSKIALQTHRHFCWAGKAFEK